MVKQMVKSIKARNDQLNIPEYWYICDNLTVYPRKLYKLTNRAIEKLAKELLPRRSTEFPRVNVKIVRDYKNHFKEENETLFIITIWKSRQNPYKLERLFKQ